MRTVLVLTIAVGCSGTPSAKWTFTAVVNAGIGDQALDLGSGTVSEGPSSEPGFSVFGEDVGVTCVHTIEFQSSLPLATQIYQLAGYQGDAVAAYTDCRFGGAQYPLTAATGELNVTRFPDSSCEAPPCIDAAFVFSMPAPVAPHMLTIDVTNGRVSNR